MTIIHSLDYDIGVQLFETENFGQTTVYGKDGQQLLRVTNDQTDDEPKVSINIEGRYTEFYSQGST